MEKMFPKEPRSGQKVIRNVALLLLGSAFNYTAASTTENGPAHYVLISCATLLLALSLCEAVQWAWRTRPKQP